MFLLDICISEKGYNTSNWSSSKCHEDVVLKGFRKTSLERFVSEDLITLISIKKSKCYHLCVVLYLILQYQGEL
ncbi:unnamed protein product [Caretta caretta]